MIFKRLTFIITLILVTPVLYAQENVKPAAENVSKGTTAPESDQQISDFSLSGYAEKGKKAWDITGKSADIFDEVIKLKDVNGNLYGEKEDVNLTASKGDFNKVDGKVHLEENVVITTSSGAKLTTDTLDWDRRKQLVTTEDLVNIEKENMVTTGTGITGEPALNSVTLKKDVTVEIKPEETLETKDPPAPNLVITCDGPLQIDYEKNIAVFNNNVKVTKEGTQIYSDMMEVYFLKSEAGADKSKNTPSIMGSKIDKIITKGNTKIVQGGNISYSDEAIYTAVDKKITLLGKPKLMIYSTEELGNAFAGN